MKCMRRGAVGVCLPIVMSLLGCSAEMAEDEDLGEVSLAFNASQCSTATAAHTVTAGGPFNWASPSNYGMACNAVDDLAPRSGLYLPYYSKAQGPTNQAQCEATTIRTVFYTRPAAGGAWVVADDESHAGVWTPEPFGGFTCYLSTSFPPQVGQNVRIATTVRRPSGSSFVVDPFNTAINRKPT